MINIRESPTLTSFINTITSCFDIQKEANIKVRLINRPKLIMMIGLPGSGKSSFADEYIKNHKNTVKHSSDELRKELYGDISDQSHNIEVFTELHRRIKTDLRNGKNVIYDATNVTKKSRISFLQSLNNIECSKEAVLLMTSIEKCIENNNNRERSVPEGVINAMYKRYCPPDYSEGFNKITILFDYYKELYDLKRLFEGDCGIDNFNQDNKHHTLTLGEHCKKAYEMICNDYPEDFRLQMATLLHDIGKIDTKTNVNTKGEIDTDYHYYNHDNVGSYNCLFYLKDIFEDDDDLIYIANLIYYHMRPYLAWKQSKKAKSRDIDLIGKSMFNAIMALHKADVSAH